MKLTKLTPWVFGILAAVFTAAAPAQAQYYPRPYFSPNGGGAAATAKRIDAARETIDIGMYSISTSGPIWESLKKAVARGVRVRVILNKASSSNKSKAKALANIGVHVFGVGPTLHEKFALIDAGIWYRRKLINGSANWSTGAETRYNENTVIYGRHYHLFYAFQQEFNMLLGESTPESPNAAANAEPVKLNPPTSWIRRHERAVFSSANKTDATYAVADEIIAMMRSATKSILVDVAHFNSTRIANALIQLRKTKPNLRIEVMLDMGEYADSKSRCRDLEAGGIDVHYQVYSLAFYHPRSQLQHHKTLIVDEKRMVTGSYNWSDTAEHTNYENAIVIQEHRRNRALVKAFVAEHDKLWNRNRDVYPAFLEAMQAQPGDPRYKKVVPVHFDTDYFDQVMSLTRHELRPIRSAAWSAGVWERQPNGKKNSRFSYLDREARDVFHGTPSGHFLDVAPATSGTPSGNGVGLTGSLPGN